MQAMLGIVADVPNDKLYVDPSLPPWLPDITLIDLRLGARKLDIHFWREGEETRFKVLRGDPNLVARESTLTRSARLTRGAGIVS
jgi:hypothetical protein